MEIGDSAIFTDELGKDHAALVTAVWGSDDACSLNVVYVSDNESETDQYGRQTKHKTSVVHESRQSAHGMKWSKA